MTTTQTTTEVPTQPKPVRCRTCQDAGTLVGSSAWYPCDCKAGAAYR